MCARACQICGNNFEHSEIMGVVHDSWVEVCSKKCRSDLIKLFVYRGFLIFSNTSVMVSVAQFGRAPVCESGRCGFKSRHLPN